MKRFLLVAILTLALPCMASAYSMILEWTYDEAEMAKVKEFRVYNSTSKALVTTVKPPATTATIFSLSGLSSFYVTAADDFLESLPSNTVSYPGEPPTPQSLKIKLVVEVTAP